MKSIEISSNIQIAQTSSFIKIKGPKGIFIKKKGKLTFNWLTTSKGNYLFIKGNSPQEESTALKQIQSLCIGVVRGFRSRLRLSGVGFRTTRREINCSIVKVGQKKLIYTKKYRWNRLNFFKNKLNKFVTFKIGFSHECDFPIDFNENIVIKASRLESRSKGSIISIQGQDFCRINQIAAERRTFRLPDIYKGKGILYNKENLRLKKGKRQALF